MRLPTERLSRTLLPTLVLSATAGLLAARVLCDRFARVTVIERDAYPASGQARAGAPQLGHAHVLHARGVRTIEQLFPGIRNEWTQGAHYFLTSRAM